MCVYVPYKLQHDLMAEAQNLLEAICFAFARRHIRANLESENLICPGAIELNHWALVFRQNAESVEPHVMIKSKGKFMALDHFDALMNEAVQLRHTAVHRPRTSAEDIEIFLGKAIELAIALNDKNCAERLESLQSHLIRSEKRLRSGKNLAAQSRRQGNSRDQHATSQTLCS